MKRKNSDSSFSPIFLLIGVSIILYLVYLGTGPTPLPPSSANATIPLTPTWPPLCDTNAIPISVLYSSEVDYYLPSIMDDFNQQSAQPVNNSNTGQSFRVSGKPICVTGVPKPAGDVRAGLVNAFVAPNNNNVVHPTIWSPSAAYWLLLPNEDLRRLGQSAPTLFNLANTKDAALAPVVIAIWKSRLEAIRNKVGYDNIGWAELLQVLTSPNGWCDYGLPDCRPAVYYGHTNPNNSPTGLSTLISEFYASARATGFTGPTLTLDEVKKSDVQVGVSEIEQLIRHYGDKTTEFKFYIAQGPNYVDFVALEENDVISINEGHDPANNPITPPPSGDQLVALYPKEGTFIHEHPLGIVNAPWVTADQRTAAQLFVDYVLTPTVQKFIMSKNFRPANKNVPLAFPIDTVNGVDPHYPTTLLNIPNAETVLAIRDSWQYVKKQADITLLIDISGSMNDDNKLTQAKSAALAFLDKMSSDPMQRDNEVGLTVFSDDVTTLVPIGSLEKKGDSLRTQLNSLSAQGDTSLYHAVITTLSTMASTNCNNRIRAIVLLSDGRNTNNDETLQAVNDAIGKSQGSACPVLVIPVAYGKDADTEALGSFASNSDTKLQIGDPNNIGSLLDIIRSFF